MERQDRRGSDAHSRGEPGKNEKWKEKKPHKRGGGQPFAKKKKAEERNAAPQSRQLQAELDHPQAGTGCPHPQGRQLQWWQAQTRRRQARLEDPQLQDQSE